MPSVARIPVPTDNFDAPHSTVAAITSLRAMAVAVDAALDSLQASVDQQAARVDALNERAVAYREKVDMLCAEGGMSSDGGCGGDGDGDEQQREGPIGRALNVPASPLRLELPSTYDRAIGKSENNIGLQQQQQEEEQAIRASAMAAARDAARDAVRSVLRSDRERDDGGAVPSDAWLDRPTAFDESAECAAAVESMTVPSLRSQVLQVQDEVAYYEEAATAAADMAAALSGSSGIGSGTGASSEDDYDDLASVRTGMTALTLSTRVTAADGRGSGGDGGGGAAERRRQRQQAQLERRRRQKRREQAAAASAAGRGSTVGEAAAAVEDIFDRASAVRQQVLSGSKPYLCDVLHDAYGAEYESKMQTADELFVFNSTSSPSAAAAAKGGRGGGAANGSDK